ncbi:hypothetical protein GCM10022394_33350 [Zobellella aerophila]|uniref:Diguanylate cyclase n=2 Tax=Zobellella aerophila TaxID=870480 RepID=A0ABP6WHH7_9GAMM
MLMALLPAFFLLAIALLALTYRSASRVIDEGMQSQFQQVRNRLQLNLDGYLNDLSTLLLTTAEHPRLASLMSTNDDTAASQLLQDMLQKQGGENLDILTLTRQGQYWTDLNSPFYSLTQSLGRLTNSFPMYDRWSWLELETTPMPLNVLVHRYPILSPLSGQVVGSLLGGLVLNDNLTLLNLLDQGIENFSFQLILQGKPVGPWYNDGALPTTVRASALASRLPSGQIQDYYFSRHSLRLDGEQKQLQVLLLTDNKAFQQLQQAYWNNTLLALLLVLIAALALALYTLKLISSPLAKLTDFAERVSSDQQAAFKPGHIKEFNFLGRSLEQMVEGLQHKKQDLANLFNTANSATIILDNNERILALNPAAMPLFGQAKEMIIGTELAQHFSTEQLYPLQQAICRARTGHKVSDVEARLAPSQEHPRHQLWTLAPIFENEVVTAVQAQGQDITRLKQAEASLYLNGLVLKNILEAVVIFDHSLRLTYVNHAYTNITGYTLAEIAGKSPSGVLHIENQAQELQLLWQTVHAAGYWQGEISGHRKNGKRYPLWLSVTALRNNNDEISHYVAVFSDISMLKDSQSQLQKMAHYDLLTGLANRNLFSKRLVQYLGQAEQQGNSLAMLFIDLDRFKQINDSLGHQAGDELLKAAAQRIQGHSRKEDILCRFGGDEFILVITNTLSLQQARGAAQRIIDAFASPIRVRGQNLYISVSIGLALYPQHGMDEAALMQNADIALYQAKEKGRNQVQLFDAEMNTRAISLVKIENELRYALEQNQMELHYQPQFSLQDGRLAGVEALVRWNKPGVGLVYPGDFIPLAEKSGIIVPLGNWILETACRQLHAWQWAGFYNIRMAVNLSAPQFRQFSLAGNIADILRELALNPDLLELEITESMLMEDMDIAITTMTELNRLGMHLAIDDFGTGYSSLAYLKNFPVRRLKIDKSFVKDLASKSGDAVIVSSIINLAHNMGIAVIAEGIEYESQHQRLRQLGCDEGQGYYLARPMPATEMEKLLQQESSRLLTGKEQRQ